MRIGVAMSGGVDSSVALFLLKEQGHDVFGVTMLLETGYTEHIEKAKRVCFRLGVDHYVVDCRKEFKEKVIDLFEEQLKKGWTPFPCAHCNKHVKFGKLLDFCKSMDAKLATGHYAKIVDGFLCKPKDYLKDQTHFLSLVDDITLKDVVFPLCDYYKSEVFRIAKDNHLLDLSTYKESSGVCFFHGLSYKDYIKKLNLYKFVAKVINIDDGRCVGTTNNFYTLSPGKRYYSLSSDDRSYIVSKDVKKQIIYISKEFLSFTMIVHSIEFKHCLYGVLTSMYINSRPSTSSFEHININGSTLIFDLNYPHFPDPGQTISLYFSNVNKLYRRFFSSISSFLDAYASFATY